MDYESERRGGEGDVPYRERGRMPRNGRPNTTRRDRPRGGGRGKVNHVSSCCPVLGVATNYIIIDDVKSGYRACVMSGVDHYVKEVDCGGYIFYFCTCKHVQVPTNQP